jgi:hypothetical protein
VSGSQSYLVATPSGPDLAEFTTAEFEKLGLKAGGTTTLLLTSCDPDALSGLREFAGKHHVEIVAAPSCVAMVKELCPEGTTVISTDELTVRKKLPIKPILLDGRGRAPVAYELDWHGKKVLFSGAMATKLNREAAAKLMADLSKPEGNPGRYVDSLVKLRAVKPDVWLPSFPTDGQNANLYDDEWERTIDEEVARVQSNVTLNRGGD